MCGVHNRLLSAALLLRRSTLILKMLLQAIQHREKREREREREREGKKKNRYTEYQFGCWMMFSAMLTFNQDVPVNILYVPTE